MLNDDEDEEEPSAREDMPEELLEVLGDDVGAKVNAPRGRCTDEI